MRFDPVIFREKSLKKERRPEMSNQELQEFKERLNCEYVLRALFSTAKHLQRGEYYSLEDILSLFSPRVKQLTTTTREEAR